jgi:hypothetical protein
MASQWLMRRILSFLLSSRQRQSDIEVAMMRRESTASDRYALTNRSANGAAMTGRSILADGLPVPHFAL